MCEGRDYLSYFCCNRICVVYEMCTFLMLSSPKVARLQCFNYIPKAQQLLGREFLGLKSQSENMTYMFPSVSHGPGEGTVGGGQRWA